MYIKKQHLQEKKNTEHLPWKNQDRLPERLAKIKGKQKKNFKI